MQYKANIQQRHDIAIERFESNLFEMIHVQQEITNGLSVEDQTSGVTFLDHYYRHLYRIFKYIDDANPLIIASEKKYVYSSIVRATLSPYELVMLYYNGFSHPKFKDLIERYAILNNIRHTWLASFDDQKLIKKKVQKGYLPSQDEDRDMSREYKKGAFVYTA